MRATPVRLLMALCVAPAVSCGGERWEPQSADLLFTSGRDGNSEVFLLRAGQAEWTNLTNHPAGDNWPGWSPDGARIVFQSNRAGNLDVWVMEADGSGQTPLTSDPEPDYLPAWSPDGATIVFTSWRREPADEERAPHIYVMNPDGSGQRRLVQESTGVSEAASWAPDGGRLVFGRKMGDGADLFVANRDGTNERRITHDGDRGIHNGSPTFSPDGASIAFYSDSGGAAALVVMHADGSSRRTLVAEGHNWYPRWSPDGGWLVYTATVPGGDEGDIDVFAVPVAGGRTPLRLVGGPGRELEGSWRPW